MQCSALRRKALIQSLDLGTDIHTLRSTSFLLGPFTVNIENNPRMVEDICSQERMYTMICLSPVLKTTCFKAGCLLWSVCSESLSDKKTRAGLVTFLSVLGELSGRNA